MKIICDCGAKYAFDASPEMVRNPVTFACPSCGVDLSARIGEAVRQEFGNVTGPVALSVSPTVTTASTVGAAPATEIAPPPPGATIVPASPSAPPPAPRISVQVPSVSAPSPAPVTPPSPAPGAKPAIRVNIPAAPAAPPPAVTAPAPTVVALPASASTPAPAPTPHVPAMRIQVPPSAVAPPPTPVAAPEPATPAPPPPPSPIAPPPVAAPRMRLSTGSAHAAAPEAVETRFCTKHAQQRITEKCRVCGKGICPKCMQLFGYVCSPHCKEKADLQGIVLPVFAGQRDVAASREWGKIALVAKLATLFIVLVLGVWFWYAWFGSRPKPAFAVRFEDEPAMSGKSAVCPDGQIVFLHGSKLARYDLKSEKEVWLRRLVDRQKIAEQAAAEVKEMQEAAAKGERFWKIPDVQELTKDMMRDAEEVLDLEVSGQNIWVTDGKKATRYDWETGSPKDEVELKGGFDEASRRGDDIEMRERLQFSRLAVTRFNLVTGKVTRQEYGDLPKVEEAATTNKNARTRTAAARTRSTPSPATKPLDPQQMASAVASGSAAARLAAPATISVARNQQRALQVMEEMEDGDKELIPVGDGAFLDGGENTRLIPTADGFIQFSTKLLELRIVERNAMKAPPKKSALDGNVSVTATFEVANELLNEMQREAGGAIVREDQSRYQVKLHLGGNNNADWVGEVEGKASVYPQAGVNVVVGGKTLIVLDAKTNQKKWESTLNYPIAGGGTYFEDDDDAERTGLGPVVERGDTLYVFDQGVLSAFELANGNARWRLPSVGVSGLYFDDKGMIYVNTTTASPDKIRYSKQIDVTDTTGDIVIKLDSRTGKEIWQHSMGGTIAHLSGKYIYTMSYIPPLDDDEELSPEMVAMGVQTKPYFRIRRINPKNGRVMWDYYHGRGALDVKIHENTFQVILKKEVQVLKFLTL